MNAGSSSNPLRFVFDMMCRRIRSWRQFANVLGMEIRDLLEEEKYKETHEKINKCIVEKRESSKIDPDWNYWRTILLKIGEEDLIDEIEQEYPNLLEDKSIDLNKADHQIIDGFGILSHYADRADNFKCLPLTYKDKIKICVGAGKVNDYSIMSGNHDEYFNKYNVLQEISKYDFSNVNKNEECQILNTQHTWLKKNKDKGFTIKGYDVNDHLQLLCSDYINTNPQKDSILTYSANHNVILQINTATKDIKTSMRNNCLNIRPLYSCNKCLNGQPFIYIPVTLHDKDNDEIYIEVKCKFCFDTELLAPSEKFKNVESFENWWGKILTEIKHIKEEQEEKTDISVDFLRSIIGFMAVSHFELPNFTKAPSKEIKEIEKLIMLTPEQQRVIYSKSKRKLIRGPFGSGKTVAAQQLIKLIAGSLDINEVIYYIFHGISSTYVQEMKILAETLSGAITVLVGDNKPLSTILEYLVETHKDMTVHVFVEEFNGETLDEEEVEKVSYLLKNEIFKNSNIVLVTQSIESDIYLVKKNDRMHDKRYQFEKLSELADFAKVFLSYLLRSSQQINKMVDVAIKVLDDVVMLSAVPKLKLKVSNTYSLKKTSDYKKDLTIQKSSSHILKNELPKTQKKIVIQIPEKVDNDTTSVKNYPKQDDELTSVWHNVDQTSVNMVDTDKLLKHFTVHSKQHKAKVNLESKYKFVGDRKQGQSVNGKIPVVYYPFIHVENRNIFKVPKIIKEVLGIESNSYSSQIYCLSKTFDKIDCRNEEYKQVIICLNDDSKTIIETVLEVNQIKWTGDPQLLKTNEFHVLLTDYSSVRGCEFLNVILILPIDEKHLKHHLVDGLSRCKKDLSVIVFNRETADITLDKILDEWKFNNLVQIDEEDYLKNSGKEEIEEFNETSKLLLLKDNRKPNVDHDDAEVILNRFKKSLPDNSDEIYLKIPPPSDATLRDIWNICKRATATNDALLIIDALERKNLHFNSMFQCKFTPPLTLLHYAVMKAEVNVIKFLIDINIDVNLKNSRGGTPLHVAIAENHIDIVNILLNVDQIDVNIGTIDGVTPLIIAVKKKNIDAIQLLLKDGHIDVNKADNDGSTALHLAVHDNNIDVIHFLLKDGQIDVNTADNDGSTALHLAVHDNNMDVIRLLYRDEQIDVNRENNDNITPLHIAAIQRNYDVLLLMRIGTGVVDLFKKANHIDVNIANKYRNI